MKIFDPLDVNGRHRDIASVLMGIAGQENCNGEPYDQIQQAAEYIRILEGGIGAIRDLISSSYGVVGLHLNGDSADWDSLLEGGGYEEWLIDLSTAMSAMNRRADNGGEG